MSASGSDPALGGILADIVQAMPSAVIAVDRRFETIFWNPEAERLTGIGKAQALGQPLASACPILTHYMTDIAHALRAREVRTLRRVAWHYRDEQTPQWVDITLYPTQSKAAAAVIRIDDITERVHIEEVLIRSEKMTTVAGLAAGMAHEINNPLGAILNGVQNTRRRFSPLLEANQVVARALELDLDKVKAYMDARDISKFLAAIESSGERAHKTISHMLHFCRDPEEIVLRPIDINALVDEAASMASNRYLRAAGELGQIHIQCALADRLPKVLCIQNELEQVLLNLIRNAADAIRERYAPESADVAEGDGLILIETKLHENTVMLSVTDNGRGMSEAVRRRIFEPFFTTKAVNQGTGLGLSVSYFIITVHHNGQMLVESEEGNGCRVSILLNPAADEGTTPSAAL